MKKLKVSGVRDVIFLCIGAARERLKELKTKKMQLINTYKNAKIKLQDKSHTESKEFLEELSLFCTEYKKNIESLGNKIKINESLLSELGICVLMKSGDRLSRIGIGIFCKYKLINELDLCLGKLSTSAQENKICIRENLLLLSEQGCTEIIKLFLNLKLDFLSTKDLCDYVSLATKNEHFEIAKLFVEYRKDIDIDKFYKYAEVNNNQNMIVFVSKYSCEIKSAVGLDL